MTFHSIAKYTKWQESCVSLLVPRHSTVNGKEAIIRPGSMT